MLSVDGKIKIGVACRCGVNIKWRYRCLHRGGKGRHVYYAVCVTAPSFISLQYVLQGSSRKCSCVQWRVDEGS